MPTILNNPSILPINTISDNGLQIVKLVNGNNAWVSVEVLKSTSRTIIQRDALTPLAGYLVYISDGAIEEYQYYDGVTWKSFGSVPLYKGKTATVAAVKALSKTTLLDSELRIVGNVPYMWNSTASAGAFQPTDTASPGVDAGWWIKVANEYAGTYSSTEAYSVGDLVLHNNRLYKSNVNREDGVWGASPTESDTQFIELGGMIKKFNPNVSYPIGTFLFDNTSSLGVYQGVYEVTAPFTGGAFPLQTDFNLIFARDEFKGSYSAIEYAIGDIVEYNGTLYKAILANGTPGLLAPFTSTDWTPIVSVNKSIQYTTYNEFKTDAATVFGAGDYIYISNPAEYLQVTVGGTGFAAITTQSLWDLKQGRALAEGAQFDTSFTPDSKLYGNEYFTLISSTASDPLIVSDLQNDGGAAIPGIGERYSFLFFNNDTVAHDVRWSTGWKTSTGGVKADITVDPDTQIIVEFIGTHVGGIPEFREVVVAAESKVIIDQWQPSTVYATGEVVWEPTNAVYLKRGTAGTSGATLDNAEKAAWETVSSYGINPWVAAEYYHIGQDVTYANKVLKQVTGQVSAATFTALESAKWQLISSQVLAWSASTFYYAGEEVNNNGVRYQKASSGVSGLTFDATEEANWLRVGEYSSNPKVISGLNYTVLPNDGIISVDSALNDVNIEFLSSLPNGKFFTIHYQQTTNNITITAGAGTDVVDPTTYLPVASFVLPGSAGQIGTTQFFKLNTTWNFLG